MDETDAVEVEGGGAVVAEKQLPPPPAELARVLVRPRAPAFEPARARLKTQARARAKFNSLRAFYGHVLLSYSRRTQARITFKHIHSWGVAPPLSPRIADSCVFVLVV